MSWGLSIFVGVLTAVVGAIVSGFVAALAVDWYHISSFEAGSAAFVFGFVFLGLVTGFIIGVITSRVIGSRANPRFWKALGKSHAVLFGLVAVVGVSARLLADVPPTIDGEEPMLAVEVRWPEGHTTSPVALPGEPFIRLGSVTRGSNIMRKSSTGPLWTADARRVGGRWVAAGAVDLFTSRGRLMVEAVLDEKTSHALMIPLSGNPGREDLEWTEWYPRARPGNAPLPHGFTFRYRVQPRSQPVRVDTAGVFEIASAAYYFYYEPIDGVPRLAAAHPEFRIRHRGEPVEFSGRTSLDDSSTTRFRVADAVAVIAGSDSAAPPALLVHFTNVATESACYLLTEQAGQLHGELIPDCLRTFEAKPLTSDTAVFRLGEQRLTGRGWLDRRTFATPGLHLVAHTVLDTRRLSVRHFTPPDEVTEIPSVPPLAVSPDERSIARFGYADGSESAPVIAVTNVVDNASYVLPIDPARMRYSSIEVLDPAWLDHHFTWQRDADGADRLVERKGFVPIPYHGALTAEGSYRAYRLEPAKEALRDTLIAFLVREMNGERVPVDSFAYDHPVKVDGQTVNVAYGSSGEYVAVTPDRNATDMTLLRAIARRFDAELATGKHDTLFGK